MLSYRIDCFVFARFFCAVFVTTSLLAGGRVKFRSSENSTEACFGWFCGSQISDRKRARYSCVPSVWRILKDKHDRFAWTAIGSTKTRDRKVLEKSVE